MTSLKKYDPDHNGLKQAIPLISIADIIPSDTTYQLVNRNCTECFSNFMAITCFGRKLKSETIKVPQTVSVLIQSET